jgi:hypothetical protein
MRSRAEQRVHCDVGKEELHVEPRVCFRRRASSRRQWARRSPDCELVDLGVEDVTTGGALVLESVRGCGVGVSS